MRLSVTGLCKAHGIDDLFDNIHFNIDDHDKIGLVGVNGSGKSTLIKILCVGEDYHEGQIQVLKDTNIGYMAQQEMFDEDITLYQEALSVFVDLITLEQQIEEVTVSIDLGLEDTQKLVQKQHLLQEEYKDKGGFFYQSRTRAMLLGLGFEESDFSLPVRALSGGQKTRAMLCKLLLTESNLLFLDEPTNYLDIRATEWLEDFLADYKGAALIVSHDRYFLDKVTNKTFEIENKSIREYSGNYSTYLEKKASEDEAREKANENIGREITRIEKMIVQQRQWNRERNIRTAEHKQKSVDRLKSELVEVADTPESIQFHFSADKTGGNDVLMVEGLSKSFDGDPIFAGIDLHIRRGEKVFLLGDNGCGKTTMFKTILGLYRPDFGTVKFGANVECGYYDQLQDNLHMDKTIFDEIHDRHPTMTTTQICNAAAAFLFYGDDVFKKIEVLSGGEKARVALLNLMLCRDNFLMMDEPTNHLDIRSKSALEEAFTGYTGTMFIISHDRYFINKLADRILDMHCGNITQYLGNYNDYKEKTKQIMDIAQTKTSENAQTYKQQKQQAAKERKRQNDIVRLEEQILETETEIERLHTLLVLPEVSCDYEKALEVSAQLDAAQEAAQQYYEQLDTLG